MNTKQETKRELKPKLRFPEFLDAGEWEETRLENIGEFTGGGTPSKSNGAYWNGSMPWISSSDISEESIYQVNINRFITEKAVQESATKLVPANSILLISRVGVGKLAITVKSVCTSQDFTNFTPTNDNLIFLAYFLKSSKNILLSLNQGTSIKGFTKDDIANLKIGLPCTKEQQKIADCLSSIDDRITTETQKLNTLKAHKKGLMQQLFPAEGETLPKLRFPEFWDAGEWKPLPIGKKVDLLSGYPFDGVAISEDSRGIRLLRGINITEGVIRHSQDIDRYYLGNAEKLEKYRLEDNDLVIGMDGSKVGKNSALITSLDSGSLLVQRVARLRTDCLASIQFIFQHINSSRFHAYVDRINTSSGIPHISAKQISDFQICFPSTDEQQKIAACLSSLDDLITAQTQKIATLKTHKKGLMQQLFPALEEVKV